MKRRIIKRALSAALALSLLLAWMPTMVFAESTTNTITGFTTSFSPATVNNGTSVENAAAALTANNPNAKVTATVETTTVSEPGSVSVTWDCAPEWVQGKEFAYYTVTPKAADNVTLEAQPTYTIVMIDPIPYILDPSYMSRRPDGVPMPDDRTVFAVAKDLTFDRALASSPHFPDTMTGTTTTVTENTVAFMVTGWTCNNYLPDTAGTYYFTPQFSHDGYDLNGLTVPTAAVTVLPEPHKVTFNYKSAPDGEQVSNTTEGLTAGDTVDLPVVTPVDGYTLIWTVTADGGESVPVSDGGFTMPDSDVTVTGEWAPDVSKLTYKYEYPAPGDVIPEIAATLPDPAMVPVNATPYPYNPEVPGYKIDRWKPSDTSVEIKTDADTGKQYFVMPANDLTMTAVWVKTAWRVDYEYNGTEPDGAPELEDFGGMYESGESVDVENAPSLTGYDFTGWDTDDVTVTGGEFTMPKEDVTFTGGWTAINYTVQYWSGNQHIHTPDGQYNIGGTVTVTANTPKSATGYKFAGWSLKIGEETKTYFKDEPFTITEDLINSLGNSKVIRLEAKFEQIGYTITYADYVYVHDDSDSTQANGPDEHDTPPPYEGEYNYNARVDLEDPAPITGYTFKEWRVTYADGNVNVETDGGGGEYFIMPAGNVTLTGVWTINTFNVTYEYDFADNISEHDRTYLAGVQPLPPTVPFDYGATVTVAAKPGFYGFDFTGWSANDITLGPDGSFTMPDRDVVLTGLWASKPGIPYHVRYVQKDTGIPVADEITGTASYHDEIPVSASDAKNLLPGYILVSEPKDILTINGANNDSPSNIYTFYYEYNDWSIAFKPAGPFTYDGLPHSPGQVVSAGLPEGTQFSAFTVEYSTDKETWSTTVPTLTDAGTVTVYAMASAPGFVSKEANVTLTVNPLTVIATGLTTDYPLGEPVLAADAAVEIDYSKVGESYFTPLANDDIKAAVLALYDVAYWQDETEVPSPSAVGDYEVLLTLNGVLNGNYTVETKPGEMSIWDVTMEVETFPYDGNEHSLKVNLENLPEDAVVTYQYQNEADDEPTWIAHGGMPAFRDASVYRIEVTVNVNGYKTSTKIVNARLVISALPVTVTGDSAVYPLGKVQPATATVTSGETVLSGTLEEEVLNLFDVQYRAAGSDVAVQPKDTVVGSYEVLPVKTASSGNFIITVNSGALTVWDVELPDVTAVYDSNPHALEEELLSLPDSPAPLVTYYIAEPAEGGGEPDYTESDTMPSFVNAGTYYVKVTVDAGAFGETSADGTLVINPLEVTVIGDSAVYPLGVYPDDAAMPPPASATAGTDLEVTITDEMREDLAEHYYTVAYYQGGALVAPNAIGVSDYEVMVSAVDYTPEGAQGPNYTIVETPSGTLNIWDVTLAGANPTYNGAAQRLADAVIINEPDDGVIESITYQVGDMVDGVFVPNGAYAPSTAMPSFVNAGTYYVQAQAVTSGDYLGKAVSAVLTIDRFSVTLTGNGGYFDYDSPDIPRSAYATLSTATPTPLTYSSAYYLPDGTFAYYATHGTYTSFPYLTGESASNPNYNVTIVRGTLTIGEAPPQAPPAGPAGPIAPVPPAEPVPEEELPLATPDDGEGGVRGTVVSGAGADENPADAADAADGAQGENGPEGIEDGSTAAAGPNGGASWSLLNLLLAILALVLGIVTLLALLGGANRQAGLGFRILAAAAGAAAPVLFFLTDSIGGRMIFANMWTILMAVILAVQVLCMLLVRMARNRADER